MEASSLEFKALVLRMLSELGGRFDQLSENFKKDIVNIIKGYRNY